MAKKEKKKYLILSIQKMTFIVFSIGAISFIVIGLFDKYLTLNKMTENIRSEYIIRQKAIIKTQVDSALTLVELAVDMGIDQEHILESLSKIRFGENSDGYIFVNTYSGIPLLFKTKVIEKGESIWELSDPDGIKVIQEERAAVSDPEGGFIYYSWEKPSNGKITPKISFVRGYFPWQWMIGAGVYVDNVEKNITSLQKSIIKSTKIVAIELSVVLLFLLVLLQLIFNKLTKKVTSEIKLFSTYFDAAFDESREIDISKIRYNGFSRIAEGINRMVRTRREIDKKIYASEQRLKLQREQSPLGYVELDLDYRIIDWNPSAERIFGYSRAEIIGKDYKFLISEDIESEILLIFDNLKHETGGKKHINNNITKDGRMITCEWYNKVFTGKNGEPESIVSIVDDISERKKMEDQLQESLAQKRILLKEVHHRVKNNMAIISSFISLQSMSVEDENVKALLKNSENRIMSMALIHEHLYRSESLQNINVQKYVEELVKTLLESYNLGAEDISMTIEIIDYILDLDKLIPLGMLINEIISNSLKHAFSNTQSPSIFLSLEKERDGGFLLIIGDNGSGLPDPEILEKSDSIGFMLINGLVQQIDGEMEIIRGNGTTYRITIRE